MTPQPLAAPPATGPGTGMVTPIQTEVEQPQTSPNTPHPSGTHTPGLTQSDPPGPNLELEAVEAQIEE